MTSEQKQNWIILIFIGIVLTILYPGFLILVGIGLAGIVIVPLLPKPKGRDRINQDAMDNSTEWYRSQENSNRHDKWKK